MLRYILPSVYVFLNWRGPDDQPVYKQVLISQLVDLIHLNSQALFMQAYPRVVLQNSVCGNYTVNRIKLVKSVKSVTSSCICTEVQHLSMTASQHVRRKELIAEGFSAYICVRTTLPTFCIRQWYTAPSLTGSYTPCIRRSASVRPSFPLQSVQCCTIICTLRPFCF